MFFNDDLDRTFALMDYLRKRFERDDAPTSLRQEAERAQVRGIGPRLTVDDQGAKLVFKADLPGLTEKDLELTIHQDVLTLKGEKHADAPQGYFVHRQERTPLKFARSFSLPAKVDPEKSTATMKDGVLTLTLVKVPEAMPRQIAIQAQ